ncbi:hypothetical protein QN367_17390 [Cryobacterium sp. RTS3]|uniref:hypothetical protein n=1 Tax=Cryobacterium sp. RTS3 TaxID=3048643 RepID=UPI002B23124A|nr:hypothetical protein [Cryobacterium sp. RTS3]MEB0000850.1 hypothetical protein [Cryobacterium sp. RTS3]
MAFNSTDSFETYLVPPRNFTKTVVQFVQLCAFAVFVGVVLPMVYFGQGSESQAPWITLTAGGATLYSQIGWTSSLYVTVLIAFFAVTIGGQIFGGPVEATSLRRTLGYCGLLLAASSIPLLVYVVCYCLSSKEDLAGLVALLPANALIIFLALHVGRFVVFDLETKLRALNNEMQRRAKRMTALADGSRGPLFRGLSVTSVAIATAASIPMVVLEGEPNWWGFLATIVFLSMLCLAVISSGWFLLRSAYMDLSTTWAVNWAIGIVIAQLLMLLLTVVFLGQFGVRAAVGNAVFAVGCLMVSVIPRKLQPQWLLNLTINGLAAFSALKTLRAQQSVAEVALADVVKKIQVEKQAVKDARIDPQSMRKSPRGISLPLLLRFIAARKASRDEQAT